MTFRSPSPKDDAAGAKPLVTWHQGGPGGNSFYGLFGEEGYFQVSEEGTRVNNATSWNLVANMIPPPGRTTPWGSQPARRGARWRQCASGTIRARPRRTPTPSRRSLTPSRSTRATTFTSRYVSPARPHARALTRSYCALTWRGHCMMSRPGGPLMHSATPSCIIDVCSCAYPPQGESYAGQYVPNIAHYILNNDPFSTEINLKGFAIGNACW